MSLIYEALKELEEPTEGVTGAESGVQKHSEPRSGSSAVSARAAPVLTRVYLIAGVTLGVVGAGWTALQMTATPDSIGSRSKQPPRRRSGARTFRCMRRQAQQIRRHCKVP